MRSVTKEALLFPIDIRRDLTEADRLALMTAVGEGFTCGNLETEDSRYAWVSPTEPLPRADAGRFDKARTGSWRCYNRVGWSGRERPGGSLPRAMPNPGSSLPRAITLSASLNTSGGRPFSCGLAP